MLFLHKKTFSDANASYAAYVTTFLYGNRQGFCIMYNSIMLWNATTPPALPNPIFASYDAWYVILSGYTNLECDFAGPLAFAEDSGKQSSIMTVLLDCR